jgi:hypothetical protein
MHSPLHLYLHDLLQRNSDLVIGALECDHAGGHEGCTSYEHMSAELNASFASLNDPSLRESDRAGAYQCVKLENGGSGGMIIRKVRPSRKSSDRSVASQGSANTLIRRRHRSGRQSRFQASSQARSQKRVFRAFDDEDDSVSSLSTSQQSFSAQPMSPSSPRSVMDAFSSSDTTDDVHDRSKSIRTFQKNGLSWKCSSKTDSSSDKNEAGLMKMPNISR